MEVNFTLNGEKATVDVPPYTTLTDMLRDEMNIQSVKKGCEHGECGACTVHMDGLAVLACMVLAVDADGHEVDTIEGLSDGTELHPIQQSYLDEGAVQCGFCTPGFIMSTKALLEETPSPSEREIREYLNGNLCRCTGYVNIVKAVQAAAEQMK